MAWSPTMFTIGVWARRGVVQVGDPVAEAGTEVQQRRRRPTAHARVPVGGAGDDPLEQSEHRAHPRLAVERGDEVHLRRARVREADVDVVVDERADQRLRAVHGLVSLTFRRRTVAEERAGVQDAVRVERGLDPPHQRRPSPGPRARGSSAAWPRRCRARRRSRRRAPCRSRTARAGPGTGSRDRAGRPRGARCRRRRGRTRRSTTRSRRRASLTCSMNSGIDARGTTTSTMSSAWLALATQKLFSRASMSCAAAPPGQHVHVDRAELGELLGERGDVLVEPVVGHLLHHHDEVRERGAPDVLGDAEVEADVGGDGRQRDHVDVLEDQRTDAARHDPWDRVRDRVERRERREHRRLVCGAAGRACSVASVTSASVPSEPMISCVRS